MDSVGYDDDELLYLIKTNNDEFAFEKLYLKYRPLIISRLKRFRIQSRSFDDYFEECVITLSEAVKKYDKSRNKSFNRFFDMCIQNKIRNLLRDDYKYFYNFTLIDYDILESYNYKANEREGLLSLKENDLNYLSEYEKIIFTYYRNRLSISEIGKRIQKSSSTVYKTIGRILEKIELKEKEKITKTERIINDNKIHLSPREKNVINLYNKGYKANMIATELNLKTEQVYNALKRSFNKIKLYDK